MGVEILQLVYNQDSLGSISKLDEGLKDATSIVLENQLRPLLANLVDAVLHQCVLLISSHHLLVHDELVVVDLVKVTQISIRRLVEHK